jgi:UDP-N-acetylglucosamine 2-epimerase (non-hydrolysing)/GDP/UDP-N,N'-diacetylbacillosamine 2-epimerase (hydrolysing)
MVGNSSSGITEAASFKLPVVNIGNRQKGRICGHNVIHVGHSQAEILAGIKRAVSNHFANSLENLSNPYGDGFAAEKIIDRLRKIKIDSRLLMKRFHYFHAKS